MLNIFSLTVASHSRFVFVTPHHRCLTSELKAKPVQSAIISLYDHYDLTPQYRSSPVALSGHPRTGLWEVTACLHSTPMVFLNVVHNLCLWSFD